MSIKRVHCFYHTWTGRLKNFLVILFIHIKIEEASKLFEGLTSVNRRHDFRVDGKLWLELKRGRRDRCNSESDPIFHAN